MTSSPTPQESGNIAFHRHLAQYCPNKYSHFYFMTRMHKHSHTGSHTCKKLENMQMSM